jgi:hypothetical protein
MEPQTPIAPPALAHIQLLTDQLDELYQFMREERLAIAQWEEDQEFSILGVLELFSGDIQGYAQQVLAETKNSNWQSPETHLRKLNVFSIDYFSAWYFNHWTQYPHVKQYVEQLDHLRLLLIEYMEIVAIVVAA